jgi:hypothetical protein
MNSKQISNAGSNPREVEVRDNVNFKRQPLNTVSDRAKHGGAMFWGIRYH